MCDATDLYAFVRRAALRTLAVVVNPKKRAGCPDGAARVAAVLASDDYAERQGGEIVAAAALNPKPPSSLAAFWDAAAADGDTQSMLLALETLAYACAFAENGQGILEDALRRLKGAKASFGAVVEGLRSGAMDHHGAREAFKLKLDGVVDDYVAGLGDAAPCKRVPAREIVVAGAGNTRGAALFWRRGISFEFAFPDAPEEAQRIDVAYATCLRSVSDTEATDTGTHGFATRSGSVVALGVRERPRGFGRSDAVDVEDDAFVAFAFDASRFAQAKASLSRAAAEYPGAFGAAGHARFLEARRAASPLKTSRGVACVVAGPPKPLAPIRTARAPNGGGGGSQRTCQTDLTSPRTAETFLGANPPAESPEPPFLTANMNASPSPARRVDAGNPESRDTREPSPSPSPSPKTSRGVARDASAGARSPSPRSPSPTPSPPPPPPSAARTGRRGAKAPEPEPEPEPAAAPEPRRSTRLTRSVAAATELAPAAGRSRKTAATPAVPAPAKRMKRKAPKAANEAPDPAPEARPPLAEMDEPNPRPGKTRRVASRFFKPAAPSAAAARAAAEPPASAQPPASAPANPPAARQAPPRAKTARLKRSAPKPTKAPAVEDTAMDTFEAFRLGKGNEKAENDAFGDGAVSPRVADAARAAEAGFWFSPRADAQAGRRAVFARDGAAPKQAARRGRSKSPLLEGDPAGRAAAPAVPNSPRASVSPPAASARVPEPARDRPGAVPVAAATAISPPAPPAPAAGDAPPRASPPTPRTARKKSMLRGRGFETQSRRASPGEAPPADVAAPDAGGDEKVSAAEPRVLQSETPKGRTTRDAIAKKPKTLPENASKRAPRAKAAKRKRAPKKKPPVVEPAPARTRVAADASASEAHASLSAEDVLEAPPAGFESRASPCVSDDFEDEGADFEKAFDATAEFVVREFEPAEKRAEKRTSPSSPRGDFVARISPPAIAPIAPAHERADEVEQRARRAAASEADAWTAAEVPTLFKLGEKASSREERRKWEIILDVVLARKTGASPDFAPAPTPTASPEPICAAVSPGAKRRASPAPDSPKGLSGDEKNQPRPAKRRLVDARAERAARASESSGEDDPFPEKAPDEFGDEDSDDEMAALERRLRSMRTTRKERAEMDIAALLKQVREEMQAQVDAFEADAARARDAAAALAAGADEKAKARVSRIVDALAAAHQAFKDAAREAHEALKDAEAASAREREEAAAVVAAEMAALGKRAEKIAARAAARAEETSRTVAKKRKDAATGNSLKSLLLRLAERM